MSKNNSTVSAHLAAGNAHGSWWLGDLSSHPISIAVASATGTAGRLLGLEFQLCVHLCLGFLSVKCSRNTGVLTAFLPHKWEDLKSYL